MKKLALITILLYQKVASYIFKNIFGVSSFCRFTPTCSEYAKIAIEKEGVFIGTIKAFERLIKCQPFYKQKALKIQNL